MTEDPFIAHRSLLFTVAYQLLGSAADAEDVLQESWLRWAGADRSQVRDPRAFPTARSPGPSAGPRARCGRSHGGHASTWRPDGRGCG